MIAVSHLYSLVASAAVVTSALAPAPRAYACSKSQFYITRLPNVAHLVGTATSDTTLTGAGPVTFRTAPGHYGPGTTRAIYGQVIDVERLGSTAPAVLHVVGARAKRVILVPWDYGPDCQPVPWTRSARWVEPGARGVFSAELRDSAHWVNGVPTLDVHEPYGMPHPSARSVQRARRGGSGSAATDSMLTPDQLLKLYDLLPDRSLMTTSPDSAVAPLRRWMRDHPELVRRTPASYIIRGALWLSEAARVRATESPLAGTYRFVLSVPTGDSVAFFARTGIHPTSELRDFRSRSRTSDSVEPARAPGYYLAAYVAKSVAELPTVAPRSPHYQQGYVAALFDPEVGTADSTVWQGSVDLIEHAARLLPPGDLRSRIEKAHATMWSMLTRDERTLVPGRFVRRAGGSVHYTLDAKRSGVQVVSMRGERIALDPLRER